MTYLAQIPDPETVRRDLVHNAQERRVLKAVLKASEEKARTEGQGQSQRPRQDTAAPARASVASQ